MRVISVFIDKNNRHYEEHYRNKRVMQKRKNELAKKGWNVENKKIELYRNKAYVMKAEKIIRSE